MNRIVISTIESKCELEFFDFRKNFEHALQNFADRICERQRRLCADVVEDRLNDHETEPFENGIYVDSIELLDADQPEIDEL